MIVCKRITDGARLGNQMFAVASVIGLAKRFGHDYQTAEWEYAKYFETKFNMGNTPFFDRSVRENVFHYDHKYWEQNLNNPSETVNIQGYLQSPNYWQQNKKTAKDLFRFERGFKKHRKIVRILIMRLN